MHRFLSSEGFRVETAADGEEGLRLARQLRPDVITLDVLMPRKDGWAVVEAENGRVALGRVAAQRPELILLDLMMPEMDGFEFLAELRETEEWRSIPVIVITAKDITLEDQLRLNGYVERILQKGAYTRGQLLAEVRNLVAACVRRDAR